MCEKFTSPILIDDIGVERSKIVTVYNGLEPSIF